MDRVVPWARLLGQLQPLYSNGERGRPPIGRAACVRYGKVPPEIRRTGSERHGLYIRNVGRPPCPDSTPCGLALLQAVRCQSWIWGRRGARQRRECAETGHTPFCLPTCSTPQAKSVTHQGRNKPSFLVLACRR